MSTSKIYQIPIVCRNGDCILDMQSVRVKGSDEDVPRRLVLAPGDQLEFSIPSPGEEDSVGTFAIVVVLDESLVDTSHVRVRPGMPATMSISDVEEEDGLLMLDFQVFCNLCEDESEDGLESVGRGNRMHVDPRRKKKRTTRPTNAPSSRSRPKPSSNRRTNASRKRRP